MSKSSSSDLVADIAIKIMMAGGIAGGGTGAIWSILKDSNFPKAAASAAIGLGIAYAAKMLIPLHEGNQRRLERAGQAIDSGIDWVTDQAIAAATRFEDKYLLCQASECQAFRSEGVPHKDGIFVPLLKEVFIPVGLDFTATKAGFKSLRKSDHEETDLNIWNFLVNSQQQPHLRQIAILAWGGYGKTTLLRHIAFRYGTKQALKTAPRLVPFLLILREYRELLSQIDSPTLPDLIIHYHIPKLSGGEMLCPPRNWAISTLRKGHALILLDGFDEIPVSERPAIARWINQQMRQYSKSTFIVTSRPKAYKNQEPANRLHLKTPVWVKNFSPNQRKNFVDKWYLCQEKYINMGRDTPDVRRNAARAAEDLIYQIETRRELQDLAKNPLLLNMIASFHRRYPGAELPKRQVELYQEICNLQLNDRPRSRRIATALSKCDPFPVLQSVSFHMMNTRQERLNHETLAKGVGKLLKKFDVPVHPTELISDLVEVSELLVKQEDEYEFSHLSFQEYLASSYIIKNNQEQTLYGHLKDDWWRPTILMYASQANPTKLIRKCMEVGLNELAYACLQETDKTVDGKITTELNTLANQVRKARYQGLKALLKKSEWKKADMETNRLLYVSLGKEYGQSFRFEEFRRIPQEEVKAIDWLWLKFSKDKFGFSVQKKIYSDIYHQHQNQKKFIYFFDSVAWSQLNFSITKSPPGHLPSFLRVVSSSRSREEVLQAFFRLV